MLAYTRKRLDAHSSTTACKLNNFFFINYQLIHKKEKTHSNYMDWIQEYHLA